MARFPIVLASCGTRRVRLRWLFEPRDIWIGLYWTRDAEQVHVYLCAVPLLPLHLSIGNVK